MALDVNSGCVHVPDELCFDIINRLCDTNALPTKELPDDIVSALSDKYSKEDISEGWEEIYELYAQGALFTEDEYAEIAAKLKKQSVVKALCLHISHDCNLRCKYCFADEGAYHHSRELMSKEVGCAAIDFLIRKSGSRRNLEVDFFGGEPLMNFDAVKAVVEYAREQEKIHGKNFRFTLTTNGILLNDEIIEYLNKNMSNVVLSLDGTKETNDKMRVRVDGSGSYDRIVPKFQKVAKTRNQENYYVRGTFTRHNLHFADDVLHLADLGFEQTSVEPVVCDGTPDYALREEDLPVLFKEYEKLVDEYVKRRSDGRWFNFFHFMIDLDQGPCVIKRLSGCGAGCEYLAIAPNGDIYPCHQFVGNDEYKMGNIEDGDINPDIRGIFEECNVYTKPDCRDCFAKFYCSGGCMANACLINGDISKPHRISCELERKRVECSLYAKAVEAENKG